MRHLEVLVLEFGAIDRLAAGAVPIGEVAALQHEARLQRGRQAGQRGERRQRAATRRRRCARAPRAKVRRVSAAVTAGGAREPTIMRCIGEPS